MCKALGILLGILGCHVWLPHLLRSHVDPHQLPYLRVYWALTYSAYRGWESVWPKNNPFILPWFTLYFVFKKKCNGSLLSAHYVACVLLGPGDWRGTVFAFLINLCPLKRSCFPLEAKGRNLGHRLGSSVVNYWPSESLSAGDACGGAQQGDERVGSMVRQTRLWSQPLPIKNGGAPGRLLSLWASLFLSTKCW